MLCHSLDLLLIICLFTFSTKLFQSFTDMHCQFLRCQRQHKQIKTRSENLTFYDTIEKIVSRCQVLHSCATTKHYILKFSQHKSDINTRRGRTHQSHITHLNSNSFTFLLCLLWAMHVLRTKHQYFFLLLLSLSTCWANKRHVNYTVCAADGIIIINFSSSHTWIIFIQFKHSERCTHRALAPASPLLLFISQRPVECCVNVLWWPLWLFLIWRHFSVVFSSRRMRNATFSFSIQLRARVSQWGVWRTPVSVWRCACEWYVWDRLPRSIRKIIFSVLSMQIMCAQRKRETFFSVHERK